ncbi:hypothetical protein L4C33_17715 [Vibrio makurazakiensis]|uniref:hypothetical protein n=1 Tax=Vibrio makurazakiensis TaxID=2910250 RepID=UPI003D0F3C7A
MKALKYFFFFIVLLSGLFTAWLFVPIPATLDQKTFEQPLTEPFKLIAYRNNPNDASKPYTYHYYVISDVSDIKELEPFLITTDKFAKLGTFDEHTFSMTVNGKIEQYTNDLWVEKSDGKLQHIYVSIDANYVR